MTETLPPAGPDERVVVERAPGVAENEGVPSNVANPKRATLRSVVQSAVADLVVLVPIANGALLGLNEVLTQQSDVEVPGWVFASVNGGIVATKLATAIVTRVMAAPGVEAFLRARIPWLAALAPRR